MTNFKFLNILIVLSISKNVQSALCHTYSSLQSIHPQKLEFFNFANTHFQLGIEPDNVLEYKFPDRDEKEETMINPEHAGQLIRFRRSIDTNANVEAQMQKLINASEQDRIIRESNEEDRYQYRYAKRIFKHVCLYLLSDDSRIIFTLEEKTLGTLKSLILESNDFKNYFSYIPNRVMLTRGLMKTLDVLSERRNQKNCAITPANLEVLYANRDFDESGALISPTLTQEQSENGIEPLDINSPENRVILALGLSNFNFEVAELYNKSKPKDKVGFCQNKASPYISFDEVINKDTESEKARKISEEFGIGMTMIWAEVNYISQLYSPPYEEELVNRINKAVSSKKPSSHLKENVEIYNAANEDDQVVLDINFYLNRPLNKLFEFVLMHNRYYYINQADKNNRQKVTNGTIDLIYQIYLVFAEVEKFYFEKEHNKTITMNTRTSVISTFYMEPIRTYFLSLNRMLKLNNNGLRLPTKDVIKELDKDVLKKYFQIEAKEEGERRLCRNLLLI